MSTDNTNSSIKKKKKKRKTISNSLPNNEKIVNIESFKDENGNFILGEPNGYFTLPYYMNESTFYNDSEYNKFIKAVEKLVRTSDYYKEYIAALKMQYGLNYCMVLGNVDDCDDVSIEMHHGPFMTLYDVISLIVNHMIVNKQKISTFRVTNITLQEHFNQNIQVIMVSKTVHELIHAGKIFIHPSQSIGNWVELIEKYRDGLNRELVEGINKYLEMAENYETTDNGLLFTNGIKTWNKEFKDIIL